MVKYLHVYIYLIKVKKKLVLKTMIFKGYPINDAAQVVGETIRDYLEENIDKVTWMIF